MFKRLVSSLPFSPALIGQIGFYARRLRQEEATRRLGLIFTALAVVVQSFAVINPPEAQAVASPQNVIFEGVRSKSDFLRIYDSNVDSAGHRDIQQIFAQFGITRADISRSKEGTFNSRAFNLGVWSVGRNSYDAGTSYEQSHKIKGTNSTVFARKLWRFDKLPYTQQNGSTYKGLVGHRADGSWFAISFDCGNLAYTKLPPPPPKPEAACKGLAVLPLSRTKYRLTASANLKNGAKANRYDFTIKDTQGNQVASRNVVSSTTNVSTEFDISREGSYQAKVVVQTSIGAQSGGSCQQSFTVSPEPLCPLNPSLPESSTECKPCPSDSTIWYEDEACRPEFEASKSVKNITQNLSDANGSTAKPGDRLAYTLTVKNVGKDEGDYSLKENLSDVLEYADVLDVDGGLLEKADDGSTTGIIIWPEETLPPSGTLTKVITVQIKDSLPATPQNVGNPESYNCIMTNSIGSTTNVNVDCPPAKLVENTVKQLPSTGPGENMLFGGILLMVVTYFYMRSRLLNKEVRLVRREFANGAL